MFVAPHPLCNNTIDETQGRFISGRNVMHASVHLAQHSSVVVPVVVAHELQQRLRTALQNIRRNSLQLVPAEVHRNKV